MPGLPFHHVLVVPTMRPQALERFLNFHAEHLRVSQFDPSRVDYVVIGGGNEEQNEQVRQVISRFKDQNDPMGSRVHFVGTDWQRQYRSRAEKEGISSDLTNYYKTRQLSTLRNWAILPRSGSRTTETCRLTVSFCIRRTTTCCRRTRIPQIQAG